MTPRSRSADPVGGDPSARDENDSRQVRVGYLGRHQPGQVQWLRVTSSRGPGCYSGESSKFNSASSGSSRQVQCHDCSMTGPAAAEENVVERCARERGFLSMQLAGQKLVRPPLPCVNQVAGSIEVSCTNSRGQSLELHSELSEHRQRSGY